MNLKNIFIFLLSLKHTLHQIEWTSTTDIQAGTKKIINSLTSATTIPYPTISIVFDFAFPTVPRIAYGFSSYRARDSIADEYFQLNKIALTSSFITIQARLFRVNTNIWQIEIRHFSVNPSFPYHLNAFHNIAINYQNPPLTNITVKSTSLQYYKSNINYTVQAQTINTTFNRFSVPLTNNKIILFMNSMDYQATAQNTLGPYFSQDLIVNTTIQTTDNYSILVTNGINSIISRLTFSMIIFDQNNIESSGKHLVFYDQLNFSPTGGFYNISENLYPNFMIGFKEFSATRVFGVISFQIQSRIINNTFQVFMPPVILNVTNLYPYLSITRYSLNVFYIQTKQKLKIMIHQQIMKQVRCTTL